MYTNHRRVGVTMVQKVGDELARPEGPKLEAWRVWGGAASPKSI